MRRSESTEKAKVSMGKCVTTYLCCLVALVCFACSPESTSSLDGQLLYQNQPIANAQVEIYLKAEKDRSVQPFAVTSTDSDGRFLLQLPSGRYYLIGKKRESAADGRTRMLMAESPGNPHSVERGRTTVPAFNLHEMGRQGGLVADAGTGLTGQVTHRGSPVGRAYVYVYTNHESGLMGPSYGEAVQTDENGRFQIALPAGSYYVVARKRAAGGRSGELQVGDLNSPYPDNPVQVPRGQMVALESFPLAQIDESLLAQRDAEGRFAPSDTVIQGLVADSDGRAVDGVYVFAYLDSRMVGKPVHISAPTGPDGRFRLYVAAGGIYYIGARSAYGGPLEPGEFVGTYDGQPDHGFQVSQNQQASLGTITVREVW
jgi:hypothetical protein